MAFLWSSKICFVKNCLLKKVILRVHNHAKVCVTVSFYLQSSVSQKKIVLIIVVNSHLNCASLLCCLQKAFFNEIANHFGLLFPVLRIVSDCRSLNRLFVNSCPTHKCRNESSIKVQKATTHFLSFKRMGEGGTERAQKMRQKTFLSRENGRQHKKWGDRWDKTIPFTPNFERVIPIHQLFLGLPQF